MTQYDLLVTSVIINNQGLCNLMDKLKVFFVLCVIIIIIILEYVLYEVCLLFTRYITVIAIILDLSVHFSILIFGANKATFIGSFSLFELYLEFQYNNSNCKALADRVNHNTSLLSDLLAKGTQINTRDYYYREVKTLSMDLLEEIKLFTLIESFKERSLSLSMTQTHFFKLVS